MDILDELCSSAPDLLNKLGFRVVEHSGCDDPVNSYVVLENENIQVKLVRDRGHGLGDIRGKGVSSDWQLFGSVAELIGADPAPVDSATSNPDIVARLAAFLVSNLAIIQELFSPSRLLETERQLQAISERRIRRLLPAEVFTLVDRAKGTKKTR